MHSYDIEQLIVHRDPMILISGLADYDQTTAHCWVDISETSPFYQKDIAGVPSYIGIEYMAQAIAAYAGAKALDNNSTIQVGFLLGSRKFLTHQASFSCDSKLDIFIEELYIEPSGLSVFNCTIKHGDNLLAEAKVNTFQPEDASQFIKENS
ncbi:3-hydroxylacyl-ACP dehydratase [Colwellia sp. D2M02]|uniref:ApeP family dehydratase n=1 Tax=Colwellia sp. D2M02 TaxID=2841562 RepID=UPI001C08D4CB|nr:3-hydroxylacyl-ACP dehydratase [Colwellia sp. D2M02]